MLTDFKRLCGLVTIAIGLAFLINYLRPDALGMSYATPLQQTVTAQKEPGVDSNVTPFTVVGIDLVIQAVKNGTHLIVDARPELFWEIGHIPGAINVPQKQVSKCLPEAEPILREAVAGGRPLLLYCADLHCPDAGALAKVLHQRGFNGLLLFEEGWDAWERARQDIEAK